MYSWLTDPLICLLQGGLDFSKINGYLPVWVLKKS